MPEFVCYPRKPFAPLKIEAADPFDAAARAEAIAPGRGPWTIVHPPEPSPFEATEQRLAREMADAVDRDVLDSLRTEPDIYDAVAKLREEFARDRERYITNDDPRWLCLMAQLETE